MSTKITALPAAAGVTTDDLFPIVDNPGGSAATKKLTFAQLIAGISGLSLTSQVTGTLPVANGGIGSTSAGSSGQFLKSNGTIFSPANLAAGDITSGSLSLARGGLGADVSAFDGLLRLTGGAASAIAATAAILTWLATPSGANLASALTSALSTSKGGTGVTSLQSFAESLVSSKEMIASFFSAQGVLTNSGTGNLDNVSNTDAGVIRFTGAAPVLRGLAAPTTGWKFVLLAAIGGNLTINDQDAGSTAANRFDLNTASRNVWQKSCNIVFYDQTTARWRELSALAA